METPKGYTVVTADSSVTQVVQKTCIMTVIAEHVCMWAYAMCVHTGVYDARVCTDPRSAICSVHLHWTYCTHP